MVPLHMVVCYKVAQFDKAAKSAKLYLSSAADKDPPAPEHW